MFEVNGIVYANNFTNSIKVTDAKVTDHLMMLITFSTGEKRVFDASILTGNAFEPLNDIDVFENFKNVIKYQKPKDLKSYGINTAPQSFQYI